VKKRNVGGKRDTAEDTGSSARRGNKKNKNIVVK
jgi:hypothetical protein